MTEWHGYFGIENLALNGEQRAALVAALSALGPDGALQPAHLNHRRVRLDGNAAIFEALWNEDAITVSAFKNRLGVIFGIDPATIDHSVGTVTFAVRETAVVTFSRGGTDYLRVVFFGYASGGDWPTWGESRVEAAAYLIAHTEDWE